LKSGAGEPFVDRFAVLDYIHDRRKKLERVILSPDHPRREAAREERDFLERQHSVIQGGGNWRSRLDPVFVERVLAAAGDPTEPSPEPGRSSYLDRCEEMGFRELRGFIYEGLRAAASGGEGRGDGPRLEEEFLDLLGLLRAKAGERALSGARPTPSPRRPRTPGEEEFAPSEELLALREECARLRAESVKLGREGAELRARSARFNQRRAETCRKRAEKWEAREREEHDRRRAEEAARYREERAARREDTPPRLRGEATSKTGGPKLVEEVARVRRDVERAFRPGGALASPGDLPWELLPPGQLTREGMLEHYRRLARAYPERGYLPERMVKAHSLGPRAWWKGRKGFYGYVVFEFAGTEKVLLECPVYGNAIYVLGSDWQRLSRKSKGAVLLDDETERIPHAGDWFGRAKWALDIR
jgi:hypothetical protein